MQQPPLPPEVGNDATRPSANRDDYIEIEIPTSRAIAPQTSTPQSNRSCLWGCGGMLGCGVILVGLVVGTIAMGTQSVFDNFTNYFNLPPITIDMGGVRLVGVPDDIYIPPVERVQTISELTTTRYNYAEVITGQRDMPAWLSSVYGDSVAMVVVGTIEAGIDVSQITAEDIVFDATTQTLTVTLPAPVLQSCFLDENQSYVVQRNTAVFGDTLDTLEQTVRQSALSYYREQALEEGILVDAEADVAASLEDLLSILVNDEAVTIAIAFDAPLEESTLPPTCE